MALAVDNSLSLVALGMHSRIHPTSLVNLLWQCAVFHCAKVFLLASICVLLACYSVYYLSFQTLSSKKPNQNKKQNFNLLAVE